MAEVMVLLSSLSWVMELGIKLCSVKQQSTKATREGWANLVTWANCATILCFRRRGEAILFSICCHNFIGCRSNAHLDYWDRQNYSVQCAVPR